MRRSRWRRWSRDTAIVGAAANTASAASSTAPTSTPESASGAPSHSSAGERQRNLEARALEARRRSVWGDRDLMPRRHAYQGRTPAPTGIEYRRATTNGRERAHNPERGQIAGLPVHANDPFDFDEISEPDHQRQGQWRSQARGAREPQRLPRARPRERLVHCGQAIRRHAQLGARVRPKTGRPLNSDPAKDAEYAPGSHGTRQARQRSSPIALRRQNWEPAPTIRSSASCSSVARRLQLRLPRSEGLRRPGRTVKARGAGGGGTRTKDRQRGAIKAVDPTTGDRSSAGSTIQLWRAADDGRQSVFAGTFSAYDAKTLQEV